ncbi:MAG TPA: hypothetical protein VEH27_17975 [Methylomirabilota bacterium]|nr:hypothetical protein [Methylomirabilota bacterium]
MKRRLAITASVLALAGIAGMVLVQRQPRFGAGPRIKFCGFTNINGETKSIFTISNTMDRTIVVAALMPQRYAPLEALPVEWPSQPVNMPSLKPGEGVTVISPAPSLTWRLPVWWDFEPNRSERMRSVWKRNVSEIASNGRFAGLAVSMKLPGQTNFSEAISPVP